MFIVLRVIKPANGFRKKLRQKKLISQSEPVPHSTENGLPFFTLDVLEEKNGINWSDVENKCGRYVSRIIAPRCVPLPDNGKLKRYVSGTFNGLLIFNTAAETIKNANLCPDDFAITVIDRNASLCGEISRLLPLTSCIRVITARPERYTECCQDIYDEYGASVIIRSAYEPCTKADIIICSDGTTTPAMEDSAVFSYKHTTYGRLRFFGNSLRLHEHHRAILPDSIDSTDFVSAVSELCGSTEYKATIFSNLEISCDSCSNISPSKCLRCYTSKVTKK